MPPTATPTSCIDCAAGQYGNTTALTSHDFSGECERGSFCDVGNTSATEVPCGEGLFCAQGTAEAEECTPNYATFCTVDEEDDATWVCGDGTLNLDSRCSGLNATKIECEVQNFDVCGSLFAAGFRKEGEAGCPPGSMCAKFRLKTLYNLNLADAILELIGFVITVGYLVASYEDYQKPSIWLNRLNVYVIIARWI